MTSRLVLAITAAVFVVVTTATASVCTPGYGQGSSPNGVCAYSTCNYLANIGGTPLTCNLHGSCSLADRDPATLIYGLGISQGFYLRNYHGLNMAVINGVLTHTTSNATSFQWVFDGSPLRLDTADLLDFFSLHTPISYRLNISNDLSTITPVISNNTATGQNIGTITASTAAPGYIIHTSGGRQLRQQPGGTVDQSPNLSTWESFRFLLPTCACDPGWTGTVCESPTCNTPTSGVCSGHGTCVNNTCNCTAPYSGVVCQTACGGRPFHPNSTTCSCYQGDVANECGSGASFAPSLCSQVTGLCTCPLRYVPPTVCFEGFVDQGRVNTSQIQCTTRTCANPITGEICSGAGTCLANNTCACVHTRQGPTCRDPAPACYYPLTASIAPPDSLTSFYVRSGPEVHYTLLATTFDQSGDPTRRCVCTNDPLWPTDGHCRSLVCNPPSSCPRAPRCPWTGCANCTQFGSVVEGGAMGFVTSQRFVGQYCCPNSYTSSARSARAECGGRGVCPTDPSSAFVVNIGLVCQCNDGLGGLHCCPQLRSQIVACGDHGACTETGECVCSDGWSGVACEVSPGCGGCGIGTCVRGTPVYLLLRRLRMDLAAYTASTTPSAIPLVSAWPRSYDGTPVLTAAGNLLPEANFNAAALRAALFNFNASAAGANLYASFFGCQFNVANFTTDLFDSILSLSALDHYRTQWRTNGATDAAPLIAALSAAVHPTVSVDASYLASATAMVNSPTATDYNVAYAIAAVLVYEVVIDGLFVDGSLVFPVQGQAMCDCAGVATGTHCQYTCPVAPNGQMCGGFEGAVRHGSCTRTGACTCSNRWQGSACETDVLGTCLPVGAPSDPLCSQHGSCVNAACSCNIGWTGTLCSISNCTIGVVPQPGDITIECSNRGTCAASGCACSVSAQLALSTSRSVLPFLPVGDLCEYNAASSCATWQVNAWTQCSGRGTCLPYYCTACNQTLNPPQGSDVGFCSCNNGYGGPTCNITLCGLGGGCNANETCIHTTGACVCKARYSTPFGDCASGNSTCRCQASLCGNGVPSADGASCVCNPNYRVNSLGVCTIVQCPLVLVADAGQRPCNLSSDRICNTGENSHSGACCYDACVVSGGATACALNTTTGQPVCACDPIYAFTQSAGICYSKCSGQAYTPLGSGGVQCACDTNYQLFPPLDTVHEYLTLASCTRVSCLNGGVVASSGQSCVCPLHYSGPVCATFHAPSSSSSSSSSSLHISSSTASSSSNTHGVSSSAATSSPVSSSSLSSSTSHPHVSSSTGVPPTASSSSSSAPSSTASNETAVAVVVTVQAPTLSAGEIAGIAIGVTVVGASLIGVFYVYLTATNAIAAAGSGGSSGVANLQLLRRTSAQGL